VLSLFIGVLDLNIGSLLSGDSEDLQIFLLSRLPRFSAGLTHEKFFIEILFLFSLVLKETKLFSLFERKKLQKRNL